jgi:hypothetical protein
MSTTSAPRRRRSLVQAWPWKRRTDDVPIDTLVELCRAIVADLGADDRLAVDRGLAHVRGVDDIWHLRSRLFGLISLRHGEHVARERLKQLDAHCH